MPHNLTRRPCAAGLGKWGMGLRSGMREEEVGWIVGEARGLDRASRSQAELEVLNSDDSFLMLVLHSEIVLPRGPLGAHKRPRHAR